MIFRYLALYVEILFEDKLALFKGYQVNNLRVVEP